LLAQGVEYKGKRDGDRMDWQLPGAGCKRGKIKGPGRLPLQGYFIIGAKNRIKQRFCIIPQSRGLPELLHFFNVCHDIGNRKVGNGYLIF
jgi:hypothetical protein